MSENNLDIVYKLYRDILRAEGFSLADDSQNVPDRRTLLGAFRVAARLVSEVEKKG